MLYHLSAQGIIPCVPKSITPEAEAGTPTDYEDENLHATKEIE